MMCTAGCKNVYISVVNDVHFSAHNDVYNSLHNDVYITLHNDGHQFLPLHLQLTFHLFISPADHEVHMTKAPIIASGRNT
jgi:hypothetical protein